MPCVLTLQYCNAFLLSSRLSLLLPQCFAASINTYLHLSSVRITETQNKMTVRTFTMPTSLNESLATAQPPTADTDRASLKSDQQTYSSEQREPLASHKPTHKSGITFAAQDKLAKLPIPDLDSSLKKYIEVLKPLQSNREQEETAAAVADFLKNDGPELQSRLKKYATGKTSYIEQFCKSLRSHSEE